MTGHLSVNAPVIGDELLDEEVLRSELQRTLRQLNDPELVDSPLCNLLVVRQVRQAAGLAPGAALRRAVIDLLDALAASNSEAAAILRRHYVDGVEVHLIARELAQVEGTINRKQRLAIARLASLLRSQEVEVRSGRQQRLLSHLEAPTYTRLFGIDAQVEQIDAPLQQDGPPWLVAVDGAGGIGKTALVDWLVRTRAAAGPWDAAAWVTARQQVFNAGGALRAIDRPALTPDALCDALYEQLLAAAGTPAPPSHERQRQVRAVLKARPHLVVLDNLESVADVDALLDLLVELAAPSKFLITTRHSLHRVEGVFAYRTPELGLPDAMALIHWEAQTRNLPALAAAGEAELAAIYAVTGGNPLALRLVAGQTHVHRLDDVLASLRAAEGKVVEGLYTHIYRHAWDRLDERGRQVLLLMPLASESGAGIEFLRAMSKFEPGQLQDALEQLVTLNLVDSRGSLRERCYSIHSLTRSFLLQQVLKW